MSERRVFFNGKWDCDMDRNELLELVRVLLADAERRRQAIIDIYDACEKRHEAARAELAQPPSKHVPYQLILNNIMTTCGQCGKRLAGFSVPRLGIHEMGDFCRCVRNDPCAR